MYRSLIQLEYHHELGKSMYVRTVHIRGYIYSNKIHNYASALLHRIAAASQRSNFTSTSYYNYNCYSSYFTKYRIIVVITVTIATFPFLISTIANTCIQLIKELVAMC